MTATRTKLSSRTKVPQLLVLFANVTLNYQLYISAKQQVFLMSGQALQSLTFSP